MKESGLHVERSYASAAPLQLAKPLGLRIKDVLARLLVCEHFLLVDRWLLRLTGESRGFDF
jgi:hypothetical protein